MDWKTILFSFGGRLNRGKYWLVVLINIIVWVVAVILIALLGGGVSEGFGSLGPVAGIIAFAAFVFSSWTGLATAIKRLHDREKSGLWLLLFWLLPGILNGVASVAGEIAGFVLALASVGISVWGFVEIACLKGTTGPNMYGPDPLPAEPD